jgi:hypothetical protein
MEERGMSVISYTLILFKTKLFNFCRSIRCPPQAQLDAVCVDLPLDNRWPEVDSIDPIKFVRQLYLIASIASPIDIYRGAPGDTVKVKGRNFDKKAKVTVDAECTTTWVSATELKVVLPSQVINFIFCFASHI